MHQKELNSADWYLFLRFMRLNKIVGHEAALWR